MPLQQLVRIALEGSVLTPQGINRKVVNSFCYRQVQLQFAIGPAPFATAWLAMIFPGLQGFLPAGVDGWIGKWVWVDFPLDAPSPPSNFPVGGNGTGPAGRLPLNQCVFVELDTGHRTRSFKGCKRWGPVSVVNTIGEEITPGVQAAMQAAFNVLSQDLVITSGGLQDIYRPVVWSRLRWPPNSGIVPDSKSDIQFVHVNRTLGQWRHRRDKSRF